MQNSCILLCECSAGVISPEKLNRIKDAIKKFNADTYLLKDLCGVAFNRNDFLSSLNKKYSKIFIIACYPRAVENLFRQNSVNPVKIEVLNFRQHNITEINSALQKEISIQNNESTPKVVLSEIDVPAWYPVIDQERCTNCGKCFKFCLFGVYSFKNQELSVENPLNCKNNCPACARTCPASAIIFPRLLEEIEIAGAEMDGKASSALMPDTSLISALRTRSEKRRSIFKAGLIEKAHDERAQALKEQNKNSEKN